MQQHNNNINDDSNANYITIIVYSLIFDVQDIIIWVKRTNNYYYTNLTF